MTGSRRNQNSKKPPFKLRSAIPGRERWDVEAIVGKPNRARRLEEALSRAPRVRQAHANPLSGRVLLIFDPKLPKLNVRTLLTTTLRDLPEVIEMAQARDSSATNLLQILKASTPDRKKVGAAVFFSVVSFAIHFCEGLFVVYTITSRTKSLRSGAEVKQKPLSVTTTAIWSVLLNAADTWARQERMRRWQELGLEIRQALRARVISQITEEDLAYFDAHSTGGLINLISEDTANIGELVTRGCEMAVDKSLTVCVAGGILVYSSPRLAALSCVPLLPLFALPKFFGKRISDAFARRSESSSRFSEALGNSLAGIIDIKSFTAEAAEQRRLRLIEADLADASQAASDLWSLQSGIGRGLYSVGMSINAAYGGKLVTDGTLTEAQYLRAVYMFPRLLDAVDGMAEVGRVYQKALSSANRLTEVLNHAPTILSGPVKRTRGDFAGEIIFDNVTFSYRPGIRVLENVSFQLRPGQTLGICGHTGSGKSTLLRLLMRFYEVKEGRILLDGRDIRELDLHDLRSAVGLVSQDVYLFQGTIRDNVLYGQPDASDDEIREALFEAGAEEMVATLPGGLQADVGERGRKLSGGERQRIAIARALLKQAPVMAFDEVTSQLDYDTEATVQRSVRKVTADRSMLTVAHRLSTIRDSNSILVLERGKVAEQGTHEDLVARNGLYASLWRLQTGDMNA